MIGAPKTRIDGPLKVTGRAKYALEYAVDRPLYAVSVKSGVNTGTVVSLNAAEVEALPGVVRVIHAVNTIKLQPFPTDGSGGYSTGDGLVPFQDTEIRFIGQDVALVVAETLEQAEYAGSQVKIQYSSESTEADTSAVFEDYISPERMQAETGNMAAARAGAEVTVEQRYVVPSEHHNALEISSCIALWKGDRLTMYDTTQAVTNYQRCTAHVFGLPEENVRIISKFIGGGFGSKGSYWATSMLAPLAAKMVGRPVKLHMSRQDMFTSSGHRPKVYQDLTIAGRRDGTITGIEHVTRSYTNLDATYFEACGNATKMLYGVPNIKVAHTYRKLNVSSPKYLRSPGEANGVYALECALDEFAHEIGMDPVELRLMNYADKHPFDGKPFSLKKLGECYRRGGEQFGWADRNREPGKLVRDGKLIGHGMATTTYPANRGGGACTLILDTEGVLTFQNAIQDIGTGTYTVMGQIIGDEMGIDSDRVRVEIGDSDFPAGTVSGGSKLTASAGSWAIIGVRNFKSKLFDMSVAQAESPHYGLSAEDLTVENGMVKGGGKQEPLGNIVARSGEDTVKYTELSQVAKEHAFSMMGDAPYSFHSFGAVFAEAEVDPDLGVVTIPRMVAVFDVGKIMNAKLAASQFYGGMIWGYGMALLEESKYNEVGRVVNADLAEYHVAVNADIRDMKIDYIDAPDYNFSEHGGRGIGEIGATGTSAAIANAIFNATGKRVRDLPITLDKLL